MPYRPYLYLHIKHEQVEATMAFLSKKWVVLKEFEWYYFLNRYGQYITDMAKVQKEDLDLHNHLVYMIHYLTFETNMYQVGLKQLYVKLEFLTVSDLQKVEVFFLVYIECSGSHLNQVRRDLVSAFKRNREKAKAATAYSEMLEGQSREHSSRCN